MLPFQKIISLFPLILASYIVSYLSCIIFYFLLVIPGLSGIENLPIYSDKTSFFVYSSLVGGVLALLVVTFGHKYKDLSAKIFYSVFVLLGTIVSTYIILPVFMYVSNIALWVTTRSIRVMGLGDYSDYSVFSSGLEVFVIYPILLGTVLSLITIPIALKKYKNYPESKFFRLFY